MIVPGEFRFLLPGSKIVIVERKFTNLLRKRHVVFNFIQTILTCFRAGAIAALRECIMLSHESNDNVCLHFAQAWLRRLNEDEKVQLFLFALIQLPTRDVNHDISFFAVGTNRVYSFKM